MSGPLGMEQDRAVEVMDELAALFAEAFPRTADEAPVQEALERFRAATGRIPRLVPFWAYRAMQKGRPRGGWRGQGHRHRRGPR